ncbi:hypothetical protein Tco_1503050 [Tanacetum coccineum]
MPRNRHRRPHALQTHDWYTNRKRTHTTARGMEKAVPLTAERLYYNQHKLGINALALSDRHPTYHKTPSDQSVVAVSTTEAEYVAAAQASKEAVWLKMLLVELGHKQEDITLFCDNQSALYLERNPAFHSKTKHIQVQYHFVREKMEKGTVDMPKIHTDDNVADYLTKAINCDKFIWC